MRQVEEDGGVSGRDAPRLDVALVGLVAALAASTVLVVVDPNLRAIPDAWALDLAINVASTLVGAALAILAWARWRVIREPVALYESSAFVALTVVNAIFVGLAIGGRASDFGLSETAPGEAPGYLWILTRFATAALLVIGAARSLRKQVPRRPALAIAVVPTIAIVLAAWILYIAEEALPSIPGADALLGLGALPLAPAALSIAVGIVQLVTFFAFLAAAVLFRRLYRRDRLVSHAFLAAGLVVAAFSQAHFAIDPIITSGVVTSADVLRFGFTAILFMGIQAELEADLQALRRANDELRRLRDVDAANAALAERTRLAREIHDGLAQDLWYAKLKQGRLVREADLPAAALTTGLEVARAIDSALAEARQAVMAMRAGPGGRSGLAEVLGAYVTDFADRFGVRAEYAGEATVEPLPPRIEAEVLRIVQEALSNVHRHADATLVRVGASDSKEGVRVNVTDNGRGFEPDRVRVDRYGLRGMRERATLIGAKLVIDTAPGDGTRVTLDLPIRKGETA